MSGVGKGSYLWPFYYSESGTVKTVDLENITPKQFNKNTSYSIGDYAIYNGEIYICKTSGANAWNAANWGKIPAYDNQSTYSIGDKVEHGGNLWQCSVGVSSPEDWDSNKWDKVKYKQKEKMSYRGVLTNMWRGCEPTCSMVSKLLKNGFFFSYPWNHGVGYLFRQKTPKLVFVFANEYDNAYNRFYDYSKGFKYRTTLFVPSAQNGTIKLNILDPQGTQKMQPVDPYCLQQLNGHTKGSAKSTFSGFMDDIGLDGSSIEKQEMINAIGDLIKDANLGSVNNGGYWSKLKADVLWKIGKSVTKNTDIALSNYTWEYDLDSTPNPFKNMSPI